MIDGAAWLAEVARRHLDERGAPVVMGIAGAVSVGKSTFAESVAAELVAGGATADVVTTDGFLFPNAVLSQRGLLMHKGFPDSYDVDALRTFVDSVRARTPDVGVPEYSHDTYDVVPGSHRLLGALDVVVIEGVNVLAALDGRLDVAVYLDAEEHDLETWYVTRFQALCAAAAHEPHSFYGQFARMSTDEIRSLAMRTWNDINLVNLRDFIAPSRALAHYVVVKQPDHSIRRIEVRDDAAATEGEGQRRGV